MAESTTPEAVSPGRAGSRQYSTNKSRVYALQPNGDQLLANGNVINWNRGILHQLWKVDGCYYEWISHAKIRQIRMFDSDFLEGGSFTFWWVVPCFYVPWSFLELYLSLRILSGTYPFLTACGPNSSTTITNTISNFATFSNSTDNNNNNNAFGREPNICTSDLYVWNPLHDFFGVPVFLSAILYFVLGVVIWTLFEYFCHRFLFHWHPRNRMQNMIHFLGHGMHHLTPVDDLRLVFPPAVSVPLGLSIRSFFVCFFAIGIANAMAAGFCLGYACYESTHYLSHHYGHLLEIPNDANSQLNQMLKQYLPWFVAVKDFVCDSVNSMMKSYLSQRFKYHSAHHFNAAKKDRLYGVTSQIWDVVFETF